MFALILALACSQPSDTAGEDVPQAAAYRQVMATVGEDGHADLYGIGPVYVPMICPAATQKAGENKSPEFLAINPLGKVPCLGRANGRISKTIENAHAVPSHSRLTTCPTRSVQYRPRSASSSVTAIQSPGLNHPK